MKALSMRISAGVIALGALLYILACSPPSGNINQNQHIAANSNKAVMELKPCTIHAKPEDVAADLRRRLEGQITNSDLADGLKPDPTSSRGTFTVEVQQARGKYYFEAYIKGEVRGDNNLKILSDIVNNFQDDPDDCLRVVHFLENLNAPNAPAGFKWSSCQYPKHVCPNGECCEVEPFETPGATPTPTSTPNPLANSGASANATKKGNTNY